jgi:Fic family protein
MVFIYKKIINKKPYYYLRLSKRVKNKTIVKDIAYLGNDISKVESKLPSKYKEEIRKAHRNIKKFIEEEYFLKKAQSLKLKKNPYLSKEKLEQLEAIRLHYSTIFLKLNEKTKQDLYHNFIIDFAFNTTSIEGNTITLEEASKLLTENLTPKNRTLREIHDLKNTEKVFFELINNKKQLDSNLIIDIHDKLMDNIDERKGFRAHDVRIFKSNFETTPAKYLKTDMDLLIKWHKDNKTINPFILASIFHQKFEKIHPFADGNGRTGRMLMNFMLLNSNLPPISIRKLNRSEYLTNLRKGNKAGLNENHEKYFKDLVDYFVEELTYNYWNSFLI